MVSDPGSDCEAGAGYAAVAAAAAVAGQQAGWQPCRYLMQPLVGLEGVEDWVGIRRTRQCCLS
jgi:hypothetical protein